MSALEQYPAVIGFNLPLNFPPGQPTLGDRYTGTCVNCPVKTCSQRHKIVSWEAIWQWNLLECKDLFHYVCIVR